MKVVGYIRVSTDKQVEEGYGLEAQEHAVRKWAAANGHRVVAIYRDEGVSGSNGINSREGLPDALNALLASEAEGLVVSRLDRLARDLLVQETTLAQVWKMGAAVFSVDQGEVARDDPDDPMRTAFRQMIGVFSQLERSMISARLRAGRRVKAQKGSYAGFGSPAFGYRVEAGELVEDLAEQDTITRIRQLHREGDSLRSIAATLNNEGRAAKRAGEWHPVTVKRVLERTDLAQPIGA